MSRRHLSASAGLLSVALLALAAANPASAAGEPVTRSGVLEVLHEDHLETGRSVHRYRLLDGRGGTTELLFDDRGPEGLGAKSVRVSGTKVRPGVVRVGSSSAVAETGDATGGTTAQSPAAATVKKVAVVMYDFADSDPAARQVTAAEAKALVFGGTAAPSVNGFLGDTSFSQLAMTGARDTTGDVFDWVTVPSASTSPCNFDLWGQQARDRAAAQGFVDAAYTQVIHLMPKSTCTFGGVAYMPGKYSWTVVGAAPSASLATRLRGVTSHEFGHSLGIHHAGTWSCTDRKGNPVTLGTSCTLTEYGDAFSVMGQATLERQYHGYQKGKLGWLSDGTDTLTVTTSGSYSLASVSTDSATTPQVLRIARPRSKGSGGDFYYLELRKSVGSFDSFAAGDPATTGVSVRIAPDYATNAISKLLDTTPGSSRGFDDAALQVGQTFTDSAIGLQVKVLSVDAGVASLQVTLGSTKAGGKPTRGNT